MEKSIKDFEKEVRELSDSELDSVAGGVVQIFCPPGTKQFARSNKCYTKEQWAQVAGEESAEAVFG